MKRPGLALGVWGEPGIGKTHTTLALLGGVPYQSITVHATLPLENIINRIPRPKKITLWLEKILERLKNNESLEIGMLNQALIALLIANAPIILHVEDLHEANESRLEFFKQLALGVTRTRGVGLIVTSRAQPPEGFEAIRLSALNREESDVLLEAEASAKLPSEALEWLFERAAGNPLFTLEFFRLLARQGSLWNDGQRWRFRNPEHGTMPVTVEALIEQTLREAANTATLEVVVGAKAVLGLNSDENVWLQLTELKLEDFMKAREALQTRGILVKNEFVHPLYREVIVTGMPKDQRQILARRALEVLKDDPRDAAEFVKDARLEASEALRLFERAAQAAKEAGNDIQSAWFKAKAVKYAIDEEKSRLALEAAHGLRHVHMQEALNLAERASEAVSYHSEAIWLIAELQAICGQKSESKRTLLRLNETERNDLSYVARLVQLGGSADDNHNVVELIRQYPNLLENPDLRTAAAACWSLANSGFLDEAERVGLKALDGSDLNLEVRANVYVALSNLCYLRNDSLGVEQYANKILEASQQIGNLRLQAVAYFHRALAFRNLERYVEQKLSLEQSLKINILLGDNSGYMMAQSLYADLLAEYGDFIEAERLQLEASNYLGGTDLIDHVADCEVRLCKLYLEWQPAHGKVLALKHAYTALEISRRRLHPLGLIRDLCYAAQSEACAGRAEQAQALARETMIVAHASSIPRSLRFAYLAQGYASEAKGDLESAQTFFQKAEHLASGIESQKIGLRLDHSTGNLEGARKRLAWFEERGLLNGVNITCRYFPELATNYIPKTSRLPESMPHLEVLGSMQTTLEAQTTPMRGRKRQELLALLLEARVSGRGAVSKLELVEKLYPEADEIQANAGLRDVIYQLRSSLGESTLTTTANGYALGSLQTDIETFLETGNTQLWRGVYLEGLLLETSDTVRESVYLALRTRAESLLETDPVEVTRVGRLLCEADPYDLEALRLTVTGLRAGQNHRSLSRFYDQARTRFLEIGEVLPVRWQDFLTPIGTIT